MPRKGILAPGVEIEKFTSNGNLRCTFICAPRDTEEFGHQCRNKAIPDRTKCKFHGGAGGRPVVTGKQIKYPVPKNLINKFEQSLLDPKLLDLSRHIALIQSQIWQICDEASGNNNFSPDEMKQLVLLIASHKELVKQETDRRIAVGSLMPVQDVMQIMNHIYDVIARNVMDPITKSKIGAELRTIIQGDLSLSQQSLMSDIIYDEKDLNEEDVDFVYVDDDSGPSIETNSFQLPGRNAS